MKHIPLILILAALVAGCSVHLPTTAPLIEWTPTATLTVIAPTAFPQDVAPTPTPWPTPTSTPFLAPTADSNPGVFTTQEQEKLYQASLKYLAAGDDDAVRVARSLGFVQGADVSNVCGPLAIKILQDAGFMPPDVDLKDFWLLNPRQKKQRATLEKVFPAPQYADYRFEQPTNTFDFHAFPLKAGDFVYLYAGSDGSFEHMLTVTRVDQAGRAYSVTNYVTAHVYFSLFAIQEILLYDPAQATTGKFYEWTDKKNYKLGLTGLGGFEVWRRVVPLP